MILILDTDHLTVIQRQAEPAYSHLRARLQAFPHADARTTIVNVEEQMRGWLSVIASAKKRPQEIAAYQRLHALLNFFNAIPVLDYDEDAAERLESMRRSRLRVGTMDLKIAAIALTQCGRLLSCNLRDFQRVPGLQVEDWTK